MRRTVFIRTCALLFLFWAHTLRAASNPYDIPDSIDVPLRDVFHSAFNLDFDNARLCLSEIKKHATNHPVIALAGVVVEWWSVSVTVLEVDPQASEAFLNASEECMELAEQHIARGDPKGEGNLALGTTLGLLSRWSASNRAWLPAYMRGSRATRYSERALRKNPKALDAYMTLGTFNYARELLRERISTPDLKPTPKTEREGLQQLKRASQEATYFKEAAGLLLAGILTNEKPVEALPVLTDLRSQMPSNGFVHMVQLTALYNSGKVDELEIETTVFVYNVSSGVYSNWFKPQAHFAQGLVAMRKDEWDNAVTHFSNAIKNGEESNPYFTWAHLYQGYAHDVLGERRKAKKMYEKVLGLKRRFASHDHANVHLSKPFLKTDPELTKLEL